MLNAVVSRSLGNAEKGVSTLHGMGMERSGKLRSGEASQRER